MTPPPPPSDTLVRPALARPGRPVPHRTSPLLSGVVAAGWSAGLGLLVLAVPVLLVWAADSRSGAGALDAVRTAGRLWLLAHSTTLETPGGPVGLAPLGLAVVPVLLLHRWAGHAARELGAGAAGRGGRSDPRDLPTFVLAVAAPYSVVAAIVAALCADGAVRPVAGHALVGAFLMAAGVSAVAALRAARIPLRLPEPYDALLRAGALAAAALLAGGALLVAGSLLWHADRAGDLARSPGPGVVGGVALLLLGLALVPNAAVWGASWLAGPGFAVGAGTTVSPLAHEVGAVPAVPLLAALPSAPAAGWVAAVALALPVLAGALAGRSLAGTAPDHRGRAALRAAAAGPVAGALLGLLCLLAGGPLGSGRLSEWGPGAWQVALAVTAEVAVGAALAAGLAGALPRLRSAR